MTSKFAGQRLKQGKDIRNISSIYFKKNNKVRKLCYSLLIHKESKENSGGAGIFQSQCYGLAWIIQDVLRHEAH